MSIPVTSPKLLIQVANVFSQGDEEIANVLSRAMAEFDPERGFTVELGKRLRAEFRRLAGFHTVGHLAGIDLTGTSKAMVNAKRKQATAAMGGALEKGVVLGGGMAHRAG